MQKLLCVAMLDLCRPPHTNTLALITPVLVCILEVISVMFCVCPTATEGVLMSTSSPASKFPVSRHPWGAICKRPKLRLRLSHATEVGYTCSVRHVLVPHLTLNVCTHIYWQTTGLHGSCADYDCHFAVFDRFSCTICN